MPGLVRNVGRATSLFLVCSVVTPVAVLGTTLATFIFAPLPAALPAPRPTVASSISRVYAIDKGGNKVEIGSFREYEQNTPVRPSDIPQVLKEAVISAEDRGFYHHGGIDPRGTFRALWADLRNQRLAQGGSTITQQYVKNAYTDKERTFVRKIREAVLASQLDRQVDKETILFQYLSNIYLGEGIYGVGAASESYFRKPVSQLSLSEAAMLAGLIPAPSRFEPRGNPALADERRRLVLGEMLKQGYITAAQKAEAEPQRVWPASQGAPPGPATVVYPSQQQVTKYPFFVDYVRRYLELKYGPEKVFRGGLEITVTVDPELQQQAEATVADALSGTKPPLDMALVAVEPPTGYVKALVGGRDFTTSQVNLALGGCPRQPTDPRIKIEVPASCWTTPSVGGGGLGRQPGSSFKPYVLATALSKGFEPTKVYSAPRAFVIPGCKDVPTKCTIGNNEGEGGGSATITTATVKSINTVYAQIVRDVGCKETAEMASRLGLTSAWYSPTFHTCSGTYALGVIDVSPLEMASAYGVFAARGVRAEPTPVLEVAEHTVDGQRHVLEDNTAPKQTRVLDEIIADTETDILEGVITGGTGTAANIGRPAAGKTGTGQNFTNAWFVGFTPTLSTAVWMGYTNNQATPLLNIKGVSRVYGGTIPARTWNRFMKQALADVPPTQFNENAPIKDLAAALRRDARGGIDPGDRRVIGPPDTAMPWLQEPPPPQAAAPTTTTIAPPATAPP